MSRFNNEPLSATEELARQLGGTHPKLADWKYKKIMEQIKDFESSLDDSLEISLQLASFGTSITMAVEDISYQNPDMLYFSGTVSGNKAQLIQHMNQLSFLLLAVPKKDPSKPPRRIGFAPPIED